MKRLHEKETKVPNSIQHKPT